MPQSMTVFNLKEISSKLKNFKTCSASYTINKNSSNGLAVSTNSSNIATVASILNVMKNEPEPTKEASNVYENSIDSKLLLFKFFLKFLNSNKDENNLVELLGEKQENSISCIKLQPVNISTSSSSCLPYHYSDYENLYVCNMCNCTYDSLRSIKAHLWKHSGHSDFSYPIHDHNSRQIVSKPNLTIKTQPTISKVFNDTSSLLNEENSVSSSNVSSPSGAGNQRNGGGICSALLEVIEKLRDEESQKPEAARKNRQTSKRKLRKRSCQLKKKLKELKSTDVTNQFMANETDTPVECVIETSVVNSLFEDEDAHKYSNADHLMNPPTTSVSTKLKKHNSLAKHRGSFSLRSKQRKILFKKAKTKLKTPKKSVKNHLLTCESVASVAHQKESMADTSAPNNVNVLLRSLVAANNTESLRLLISKNSNSTVDLIALLSSLAQNDAYEQYVCGLCPYVCYHLRNSIFI